ncbi:MAG TPA: methionine--tRNA ligase [Bacteroidales bacterium]|nr:methionine--tRNA ligase [Bacteroidales bacterium]HXK90871.1 methionine--tRNA ligase [Bacteroidales bacterium]
MSETRNFKRYTITTALPYANGPIHIGHLAGVYVPADIFVRYLRMRGREVLFVGGSDEHGVPITIRAKKEGVSPQQIVDHYHNIIKKSFEEFGISFDIYSRTSSQTHHKFSQDFFLNLLNKGELITQQSLQYFDEEAGQFLADRYIVGTCPNCGYDEAYGDQCEKCGSSLSPQELINPHSTLSGSKPVLKETKHWYLPLDKYEPWLRQWILEEHKEWKTNVYGQCKSWLDNGLQPRAVTRDLDWGVPVPLEEAQGKVLYVWFEAPLGYVSATIDWAAREGKDWQVYWKDQQTRLIHFIGKDNIVFHCIIFPTMLKMDGSYILPDNVPANEFMNLEGKKISTSRNWAVWLNEYLEDFPGKQDVLRYVLTANMPETKDNDFTWKNFQQHNNNELAAIYGNLVNRAIVLTHKYYNGKVPENFLFEDEESIYSFIANKRDEVSNHLEQFRFRDALNSMMDVARFGNKYLTEKEPWKLVKSSPNITKGIIYNVLQIIANLALLSEPFLPFTAKKLREVLNIDLLDWDSIGSPLLKTCDMIAEPSILFEQITDEMIEKQLSKLHQNDNKAIIQNNLSDLKPAIKWEDFDKIDLRIGRVLSVDKVPDADKLLKLELDFGGITRTIISGIAQHIKPEEIIGKNVIVVANLEKKKIRGIESEGMVIFAENKDGKLLPIFADDNANPGDKVK